jgi:hypothetical protein
MTKQREAKEELGGIDGAPAGLPPTLRRDLVLHVTLTYSVRRRLTIL